MYEMKFVQFYTSKRENYYDEICQKNNGDIVRYGKPTVEALKKYAQSLPQKRARILLHGHESNCLHEMLIVAPQLTIWPPLLNERPPQSWR